MNRRSGEKAPRPEANATLADRVAALRRLTSQEQEPREPIRHFHDELARFEAFLSLGVLARSPALEELVQRATAKALSGYEITSFTTIHVAEHALWHGSGRGKTGGAVVFFFFEDAAVGAAHVTLGRGTAQNHYLRLAGT